VAAYGNGAASEAETTRVRQELHIPDGAFMLTVVAELIRRKRHDRILRALADVQSDRVTVVLVGDGPLESSLREKAVALGVNRRVRWAGYRRDVPVVLAASDALAIASEHEGLNRSVLEAMASGKPVIGTDTRGVTDAVRDDAGWIVAQNDLAGLAAAIDHAAAHPEECAARGAVGRARAEAEYALPRIIDAYEELYREALASRV